MNYDVAIVGGGHNGLVCAAYLARAGLRVKVLERRHIVGGAAVTEEFYPGFRNSVASYTVSLLHPRIIEEMNLAEHGLEIRLRPQSNFFPVSADDSLSFFPDGARTRSEIARFSEHDAAAYEDYERRISAVADFVRPLLIHTPPNAGGGLQDMVRVLASGNAARKLDVTTQRDVLAMFTLSATEFLEGFFEDPHVKAAFAFDAIVGTFAPPSAPGTAYVLLHHVIGEANGVAGAWGHAVGGMGAITQAMLAEVERLGVDVETNAPVAEVRVAANAAIGVCLEDGREVNARAVAANVGPKVLFEQMLDPQHIEADFLERIRTYKTVSGTLRMNVALAELPRFSARPEPGDHLASGIVMGPSLEYLESAYHDARRDGWSKEPVVEMLIPSTIDGTLAPTGKHVASLFCQHFSPDVDWDTERESAADDVFKTIDRFAPNFSNAVLGREILTPLDLERRFGLTGGDIFHGALQLNQLWSARPVLGHADYRMPVSNLYLCGSGAHPGGGVSGLPGYNAAREILRDRRRLFKKG